MSTIVPVIDRERLVELALRLVSTPSFTGSEEACAVLVQEELQALGAFRADVTGAGPTVYGLFHHRSQAKAAQRVAKGFGRTWLTAPAWYG